MGDMEYGVHEYILWLCLWCDTDVQCVLNTYFLSVLLATIGSESLQCDQRTGACTCKAGVGGVSCDHCQDFHYRFSDNGCRSVYSNQLGTLLEMLVGCACP